ncbi:MAG: hypothetical protein AABX03_01280 [Nanoarchaeota archaeon]
MAKKEKQNKYIQRKDQYSKWSSYKNSFFLGIIGLLISITSLPNKNLDFISYPLLVLSILVLFLGFWQLYNFGKLSKIN